MVVVADIGLSKFHAVRFDKFNRVIFAALNIESIIAIGIGACFLNEISVCIIQVDAYAADALFARVLNPVSIRIEPDLITEKCPCFDERSLTDFTSAGCWNFGIGKFAVERGEETIVALGDGKLKDIGCE